MKLRTLLYPLVLTGGALGQTIQEVCNAIKQVYGCHQTVKIPTGAAIETCPNKFFEPEPCKTRLEYRYPCPIWSQPGRMCDGWTCVPGTNEIWIDAPCGIKITTKDVDLCDLVRGGVGVNINEIQALCNCLPRMVELLVSKSGSDLLKSVEGGQLDGVVLAPRILNKDQCVTDNSFNIHDNKEDLMAGDLAATNGWIVLTAAEIDMATYIELAMVIEPCVVGTCNPNLIRSFFTSYITRSQQQMGDQIVGVLEGWINIFGALEKKIAAVISSAEYLGARLQTVPTKLTDIEGRICRNDACIGSAMAEYVKKLSAAIAAVQAFQDVRNAAKTVIDVVPKLVSLTRDTVQVAKTIPEGDFFLDMVKNGDLTKIGNILSAFKITTELPALVPKLQGATSTLTEFATKYGAGRGAAAAALLTDVISTSWESLQLPTDASTAVRKGLQEIQSVIQSEIQGPFKNVTDAIKDVENALDVFPVKPGRFAMRTGVASYQRWSIIVANLACSRTARAEYELGGFKGSFDYPEFYTCPVVGKLPWPNHHIPYVKIRVQ
ncbi:hypothetical protein B0T14DRAFT_576728 [Immersiella caudata]|uniref:Uncharacterized protein n=1 Tax=Immersiella caudata TaxID=314043 RepID=A0AA40CE90_9PEZI|nr:hypothetical protein B0T14DRAFT_576728 [Immersiella caudata]